MNYLTCNCSLAGTSACLSCPAFRDWAKYEREAREMLGCAPASSPGWVCPKCGRVYGPNVSEYLHCNINTTETVRSNESSPSIRYSYSSSPIAGATSFTIQLGGQ